MDELQQRILLALAADDAEFSQRTSQPLGLGYRSKERLDWIRQTRRHQAGGWISTDWRRWCIATGTPALRQRNCRALKGLEAAGLIERSSDGDCGDNLARLTAAGRQLVDQLTLTAETR